MGVWSDPTSLGSLEKSFPCKQRHSPLTGSWTLRNPLGENKRLSGETKRQVCPTQGPQLQPQTLLNEFGTNSWKTVSPSQGGGWGDGWDQRAGMPTLSSLYGRWPQARWIPRALLNGGKQSESPKVGGEGWQICRPSMPALCLWASVG